MNRILVPTDFSPQAENALKVAAQIAKRNNSEIYLEHSLNLPTHINETAKKGPMPESLAFVRLAEEKFEEILKKPYLAKVAVKTAVGHSEIYEDINQTVKEKDINLIVMGSHGASGFKQMFIGSNAEKVVRTASIPVLVIKNEHPNFEVNDFVYASDFSDENIPSFKKARDFAHSIGATLNLLHVNTPSDFKTSQDANKLMHQFLNKTKTNSAELHIYNDLSVEKGILNFAKNNKMQLIGMSTHGRKGLAHFFNGSISEDLVNHANMPVITFKI